MTIWDRKLLRASHRRTQEFFLCEPISVRVSFAENEPISVHFCRRLFVAGGVDESVFDCVFEHLARVFQLFG